MVYSKPLDGVSNSIKKNLKKAWLNQKRKKASNVLSKANKDISPYSKKAFMISLTKIWMMIFKGEVQLAEVI